MNKRAGAQDNVNKVCRTKTVSLAERPGGKETVQSYGYERRRKRITPGIRELRCRRELPRIQIRIYTQEQASTFIFMMRLLYFIHRDIPVSYVIFYGDYSNKKLNFTTELIELFFLRL